MSRHRVKMPTPPPVEVIYDCMGDDKQINIYANRFRGQSLLSSKCIATLSIEKADELVKKLSAEIHRDPRLIAQFGGTGS